jgi:Flp pilus assembly protein TadB
VTVALLAGLLAGLGLWLAWTGLRPAPEPLAVALARVGRPPAPPRVVSDGLDDRDARIGGFLLGHLPPLAARLDALRADLRIVGREPEVEAVRVAAYVLLPLLLGPWIAFLVWVFQVPLPSYVAGGVALAASAAGLVLPFVSLRAEAAERRRAFAHALSSWCDVVVMTLASGRGVEQAIETAGAAGEGWAFAELRGAVRAGYVRGEAPWVALERLGADLGVSDLSELASTVALAGEEGAAVRATVAAKARTMRERMGAESELAAAAVTEKMSLPNVLLVVGFLVFLCYPALVAMLQIRR